MSDYFKFLKSSKTDMEEDEEAYEEQRRAFEQAREILRQQEIERSQKHQQEEEIKGGITLVEPNMDISKMSQQQIDQLLRK